MKKQKHKEIIYNIFRCNKSDSKETLNDILKGTKSVLASKTGFQQYIHNYSLSTKKPSFKTPGITEYPLLKSDSTFLVPVKKRNYNKTYDNRNKNRNKFRIDSRQKLLLSDNFFKNNNNQYLEQFNKRFIKFLNLKQESNNLKIVKRNNEKNQKRYNSLFLDFFSKWNEYDNVNVSSFILNHKNKLLSHNKKKCKTETSNNMETKAQALPNFDFLIKKRYSGLYYDEKAIFNTNYDKFILSKIHEIKNNKIKNYINDIESCFDDLNHKEIQLKLKSIKLNFYPQTQKINCNYNNFYLYLPLSFVFLFYYNDFEFFQKILMSIIYFEKDFKNVKFNDDKIYQLLNIINTKDETLEDEEIDKNKNKDVDYLSSFRKPKKSIDQNTFLKTINNKDLRKTYNKGNPFMNKLFIHKNDSPRKDNKDNRKIRIIHSNYKLRQRENNGNNDEESKNKENTSPKNEENFWNKNEIIYNEYYFMWETPKITYKVKMEMPKIYFLYEGFEHKIVTYCEKHLFLYLYKNNFINWDFFALNYIFSIKVFRTIVIHFLSFNKDYIFLRNSKKNKILSKTFEIMRDNNNNNLYNLVDDDEDKKRKNILLVNKKIYDQMSDNNESYIFFYTDSNLDNYILNFYSYQILIEYKKLNPKLKWEFHLNFKQMKYLNEVSKYEQLNSFLPKIINTSFENGLLSINFGIFDEHFNPKILGNKQINTSYSRKGNEMNIEINKPYLEIEKVLYDHQNIIKKELEYKFLHKMNKIVMSKWSKYLLELLDDELNSNREKLNKMDYFKNKYFNDDISKLRNTITRFDKQKLTFVNTKRKNDDFTFDSEKKIQSHEA